MTEKKSRGRPATLTTEARREQQRIASKQYRDRKKAEGSKAPSGPSGKSGGKSTQVERARRYRANKKQEKNDK